LFKHLEIPPIGPPLLEILIENNRSSNTDIQTTNEAILRDRDLGLIRKSSKPLGRDTMSLRTHDEANGLIKAMREIGLEVNFL
jgi:hypothetical protein